MLNKYKALIQEEIAYIQSKINNLLYEVPEDADAIKLHSWKLKQLDLQTEGTKKLLKKLPSFLQYHKETDTSQWTKDRVSSFTAFCEKQLRAKRKTVDYRNWKKEGVDENSLVEAFMKDAFTKVRLTYFYKNPYTYGENNE